MKINKITPQYLDNKQQNKEQQNKPQFTGAADVLSAGLRFLDTNQAVGACSVDLCSMVIPRSTVDFVNRGPSAGTETLRREATGTTNHASVGLYGTLAGFAIANGFNRKYGVKAHKIFADNHTINIIAESWNDAVHDKEIVDPLKKHVDTFLDSIKAFNSTKEGSSGYVNIAKADKAQISDFLYNALKNSKGLIIDKDTKNTLYSMITAATGGEKEVLLASKDGKHDAANTLRTLISNFFNITKVFDSEKGKKVFESTSDLAKNELVNSLKSINLKRSIGGLGIATAIGMSTQPINMYLTKKKTGQDGFVGVEGRTKDTSAGFKVLKTIVSSLFALGALATITVNPKKFLSKIQFQGMLPTLDQLKLVYGMTITSRLIVARDKDELRESAVKDSLGFLNLLILGNLVTKGAARIFNKSLINRVKTEGQGFWAKMSSSSLKTRDEVLFSALKANGIKVVENGKAIPFKQLLEKAKDLPESVQTELKSELRALNISQIAGYLYSGLILGIGIPKLNIYMTNKSEAKRKAKLAAQKAEDAKKQDKPVNSTQNVKAKPLVATSKTDFGAENNANTMLSPENLQFLYQKM